MYGSPNMIAVEFYSPITMVNILPGKSQQTTILKRRDKIYVYRD